MYEKCTPHCRFEADPRMVAEKLFAIHHYAGLVEYSVEGFMEKNKDELPKSSAELLLSSSNKFVKIIANEMVHPSSAQTPAKKQLSSPRGSASQRPTVGIQFSAQLHDLRKKIDDTSPHCEFFYCVPVVTNNAFVSLLTSKPYQTYDA
jgi:myosin-5